MNGKCIKATKLNSATNMLLNVTCVVFKATVGFILFFHSQMILFQLNGTIHPKIVIMGQSFTCSKPCKTVILNKNEEIVKNIPAILFKIMNINEHWDCQAPK